MLEFQNTKTFLVKDILQIGQKKFLLLVKLKIHFLSSEIKNTGLNVVSDLNGEGITGSFCEKELQKTSQKKFRREKILKRKWDKF